MWSERTRSCVMGAVLVWLVGVLAAPAMAEDTHEQLSAISERWLEHCQAKGIRNTYLGEKATQQTLMGGARVLMRYGLTDRLGQMRPREACLSLVASESINMPTVVVEKAAEDTTAQQYSQAMRHLFKPGQKAFHKRLARLDIGHHSAGAPRQSTTGNPYPQKRVNAQIRATALEGYKKPRSFSASFSNHCLIGLDTRAMSDYIQGVSPELKEALSPQHRRWLESYGNAMDFWHEVGHCRWHSITTADADAVAEKPLMGTTRTSACSVTGGSPTSSLDGETQRFAERLLDNDETNKPAAILDPLQNANSSRASLGESATDARIIERLTMEAVADSHAIEEVSKRFEQRIQGCRADATPDAWSRFRLMMSLHQPRPRYMTWVMPYLRVDSPTVRAQVIADAWAGLRKVAFTDYAGIRRESGLTASEAFAGGHFPVPSNEPNAQRSRRWADWIRRWFSGDGRNLSEKSDNLAIEPILRGVQ